MSVVIDSLGICSASRTASTTAMSRRPTFRLLSTPILVARVHLEKYRGRCCYARVVQAADYFLRRHTGRLAIDSFRYKDAVKSELDRPFQRSLTASTRLRSAPDQAWLRYLPANRPRPLRFSQFELIGHSQPAS